MTNELSGLTADITARLERLLAAAKRAGREEALHDVRALVGGAVSVGSAARGAKKSAKVAAAPKRAKKARKNPWLGLSPEAHLARRNAIRRGRGLPIIDGNAPVEA